MGFILPQIHFRDNLELKPGGYQILIKGCEVAQGELLTNHLLAMNAEEQADNPLGGIPTREPPSAFRRTGYRNATGNGLRRWATWSRLRAWSS